MPRFPNVLLHPVLLACATTAGAATLAGHLPEPDAPSSDASARATAEQIAAESRALRLNGVSVQISTGQAPESAQALLDREENACRRAALSAADASDWLPALTPMMRWSGADGGTLVCMRPHRQGMTAFVQQLGGFLASGDLGEVGDLSLLHASHSERGATFVRLDFDGPMPLSQLLRATKEQAATARQLVPAHLLPKGAAVRWVAQEEGQLPVLVVLQSAAPMHVLEKWLAEQTTAEQQGILPEGTVASALTGGGHWHMNLVECEDCREGHLLLLAR